MLNRPEHGSEELESPGAAPRVVKVPHTPIGMGIIPVVGDSETTKQTACRDRELY